LSPRKGKGEKVLCEKKGAEPRAKGRAHRGRQGTFELFRTVYPKLQPSAQRRQFRLPEKIFGEIKRTQKNTGRTKKSAKGSH